MQFGQHGDGGGFRTTDESAQKSQKRGDEGIEFPKQIGCSGGDDGDHVVHGFHQLPVQTFSGMVEHIGQGKKNGGRPEGTGGTFQPFPDGEGHVLFLSLEKRQGQQGGHEQPEVGMGEEAYFFRCIVYDAQGHGPINRKQLLKRQKLQIDQHGKQDQQRPGGSCGQQAHLLLCGQIFRTEDGAVDQGFTPQLQIEKHDNDDS